MIAEALANEVEVGPVIVGVDATSGEHPVIWGEDDLGSPPQHQNMQIGFVVQEQDRGGRNNGDFGRVEVEMSVSLEPVGRS